MSRQASISVVAAIAAALAVAACGDSKETAAKPDARPEPPNQGLPQGSEPSRLDPADFTTDIDNPYWPMRPGARWVYRASDTTGKREQVVVTVTDRTRKIANGIVARVVRDVVTEGGSPTEVTDDWYAQDSAGNVWYLGEATAEYEDGKVIKP